MKLESIGPNEVELAVVETLGLNPTEVIAGSMRVIGPNKVILSVAYTLPEGSTVLNGH